MTICELEGCNSTLRKTNTIGYCRTHRGLAPATKMRMREWFESHSDRPKACVHPGCTETVNSCNTTGFCSTTHNREYQQVMHARKVGYEIAWVACSIPRCDRTVRHGTMSGMCRKHHHLSDGAKIPRAAASAKRRATLAGAAVENVDRRTVWLRDAGICHICRNVADPTDWHMDHIFPLSRGGDHSYANVAVSHPLCNLRKHAKVTP